MIVKVASTQQLHLREVKPGKQEPIAAGGWDHAWGPTSREPRCLLPPPHFIRGNRIKIWGQGEVWLSERCFPH